MAAVHQMDLETLPPDKVDILSRILPNEEERKLFAERGDDEGLSDEVGLEEPEGLFMVDLSRGRNRYITHIDFCRAPYFT